MDPYNPCPCGSGKKIKFCCSADLVHDLERAERMLEGDQALAALDFIRKLDEKHPNRPAIMALRIPLENALHHHAEANEVIARYLQKEPNSPTPLALKAILVAGHGHEGDDPLAAIGWLQRGLEAAQQEVSIQLYDALGVVASALLHEGHIVPARALLQLQVGFSQAKDQRALQSLLQLEGSPQVPVPLKNMPRLDEPPAEAPYREAFQKALELAHRGNWQAADTAWTELAPQAGELAGFWRNLATVRSYLGNYSGAVEALRKFQQQTKSLDEQVEAESIAQLLVKDAPEGQVEEIAVTFPLTSDELAQEKLAGDKRIERLPLDTGAWTASNQVPPRAAYTLLDRPVPSTGMGIAREAIPSQIAQGFLFGKQTDREARMEIMLFRPELPAAQALLKEILGDLIGEPTGEESMGKLGQVEHALSWHWRLPDDTPEAERRQLSLDQRRHMVLQEWPKLKQAALHGCAPEQVASDPSYRARLLAGIWLLQLADADGEAETYNALRRKLNLPEMHDLDPTGLDFRQVNLGRLCRFDATKLTDEQLKLAFNRAAMSNFALAVKRLAPEVIARPGIPASEYKLPAYQALVRSAGTSTEAMRLIDEARAVAATEKQSAAPWHIMELAHRLERGEMNEALALIRTLQQTHGREPGVMQALLRLLASMGLVTPDGQLALPMAAPAASSPLVMPGAAPTSVDASKLWTPGGAAPASGEKKSALWVPE